MDSTTQRSELDELYLAMMRAETDEQAALLMLNASDDHEVRVAHRAAIERVEETREAYDTALSGASTVAAVA